MTTGAGAPSAGYLICSVERSGSTLLASLLESTGVAGRPVVEPFNLRVQASAFRGHSFVDYGAYLRFVRDRASSANGVFGVNLMWRHWARVSRELDLVRTWERESSLERLQHYLPGLDRFVFTQRRDRLAQAVSWAIAYQTGRWRSSDPDLGVTPSYEFALVDSTYQSVEGDYLAWETWFALHRVDPLTIYYEDLVANQGGTVNRVLEFLGVAPRASLPPSSRLVRQATEINDEWCARYRADLAASLETRLPADWVHDG